MHHQHFPTLIHGFPVRAHRVFKRRALSKRLARPKRRRPHRVRVSRNHPHPSSSRDRAHVRPERHRQHSRPVSFPAVARRRSSQPLAKRARPSRRAASLALRPVRRPAHDDTVVRAQILDVWKFTVARAVVMPRLVVASEELHDASRQAFPSMIVFAIDHGEGFRHVFARAKTRKSSE